MAKVPLSLGSSSSPAHSRLTRESDDTACSAETPSAWRLDMGRRMFLSVPSHHSRPHPNPSHPTPLWYFPFKSCPSIINILPFYAPRPSGKAKERNQPLSQTRADSAKQTDVTSQAWCARRSFWIPRNEVTTQLQFATAESFERMKKELNGRFRNWLGIGDFEGKLLIETQLSPH